LAETGNRAIDKAGVDRAEGIEVQAETFHHAGTEVFDNHVARSDELLERFLVFDSLQVEGDRTLVSVLCEERSAHQLTVQIRVGAKLAREVARSWWLDLDHVCSKQCELVCAKGPGEDVGEVEHANALE